MVNDSRSLSVGSDVVNESRSLSVGLMWLMTLDLFHHSFTHLPNKFLIYIYIINENQNGTNLICMLKACIRFILSSSFIRSNVCSSSNIYILTKSYDRTPKTLR